MKDTRRRMEYYARQELEKARTVVPLRPPLAKPRVLDLVQSHTSSRLVAMPSGTHVATSGDPVAVYDQRGALVDRLASMHVRGGRMCAAGDDVLVTVDREGLLALWAVSTTTVLAQMTLPRRAAVVAAWSPGLIAVGDEAGGITLLRHSHGGRRVRHVHCFEAFDTKVCYMDACDALLVACSRDGKIAVFDRATRCCKAFFPAPYNGPCRVAVVNNHIVAATFGELRVYETYGSCPIRLVVTDAYPVDELRLPVLRIVGSFAFIGGVGESGEISVICLRSGECVAILASPFAKLRSLDVAADGRIVVASAEFNHYGFAMFRCRVPSCVQMAMNEYVAAKYRGEHRIAGKRKQRNLRGIAVMAAFIGCVAVRLLKTR